MKVSSTIILATALVGGVAIAAEMNSASQGMMGNMPGMAGMMSMMRSMETTDANGDQMVSKDEFLKSHEAMFDAMEKNKDGLVAMKDMPCM